MTRKVEIFTTILNLNFEISRLAQKANDLREDFDEFDRNKDALVDPEEVFIHVQSLLISAQNLNDI